ncbi:hypothetical protein [Spirosoma sp. 209]|uniref:hypothetical protein n=1 Tax=Spirosoma sp. 209 TaxID=1955701 RepID=UPI00098D6024|nr:hypothetical protein [Spirosoma sp. 209]
MTLLAAYLRITLRREQPGHVHDLYDFMRKLEYSFQYAPEHGQDHACWKARPTHINAPRRAFAARVVRFLTRVKDNAVDRVFALPGYWPAWEKGEGDVR